MIIEVADQSQVHGARKAAAARAEACGLAEDRVGRAALIATEMATNLVKHALGGKIIVNCYEGATGSSLELLSIDSGPGIRDLGRALSDGYSTAGSMGGGLGAMRRLADSFDIFSRPGAGTVIVTRLANAGVRSSDREAAPVVGSIVAPFPGQAISGDAWAYEMTPDGPTVMMVDGSGHGIHAAAAARAAVEAFRAHREKPCVEILQAIHRAMAPTRGGAVALARIDPAEGVVRYVGLGNIAGTLVTNGATKKMVSNNGIAGHVIPRLREFAHPYEGSAVVILHSDGLSTRWDIVAYPGLEHHHPSALAGILFRDHFRGRDDGAVLALRV